MQVTGWRPSEPTYLVDVTRLLSRLRRPTPRGIDRVLLEYAQHFAARRDRARFVAYCDPGWVLLPPALVARVLTELSRRWLRGPSEPSPWTHLLRWSRLRKRLLCGLGRPLSSRALPPGRVAYVNVSHNAWSGLPALRSRLGRVLYAVVMVHDLMPLTAPELFSPSFRVEFQRGFRAVATHADLILVNSDHTGREVRSWLPPRGAPSVARVGLATRADRGREPGRLASPSPYFVHLGALDERKNLSLLIDVWRELSLEHPAPPRLEIIGPAGSWTPPPPGELGYRICVHHGLSDAAVSARLRDARALLHPSTTEGFGLPVLEAVARGVPAIASDLPAVREHSGAVADLLPAQDGAAWLEAVRDYSRPRSERRRAQLERLARYEPPRWAAHFAALDAHIAEGLLSAGGAPPGP